MSDKEQNGEQETPEEEQPVPHLAPQFENKFDTPYMGYSNYFTWLMHLEVVNDEASYLLLICLAKQVDSIDELAEHAKKVVVGNVPLPRNGNVYMRLLSEAFDAIDWKQVVQFIHDEAQQGEVQHDEVQHEDEKLDDDTNTDE